MHIQNPVTVINLSQGWAHFLYGGPHFKTFCSRGPHTLITK